MSWIYSEPKIQSSRPNHSCCRRPKHSCHLNPPLSQPPSPAPESHCSQADFDPVFNDMDNATAGRPCGRSCGRDPTNMMQSTRRRRRAAPVRGGGTECKKRRRDTDWMDLLVPRLFMSFSKPCGYGIHQTRQHSFFSLDGWTGARLFAILRV